MNINSAELSSLWSQFMSESMDVCVKKHVLLTVKDHEVLKLVEHADNISKKHLSKIEDFFQKNSFSLPIGFIDEDVMVDAPPLFYDEFWAMYLHVMSIHGMTGYSLSFSTSTDKEIRDYFSQCIEDTIDIYNKTLDFLLKNGLFHKPYIIDSFDKVDFVDFVDDKQFMAGFFGDIRPLNGIESTHILFNLNKNILLKTMSLGFSRVCSTKNIKDFFNDVYETSSSNFSILNNILLKEELPTPPIWEDKIYDTAFSPFSEKMMLYHISQLVNFSVAYYGTALSTTMRRDIGVRYLEMIAKKLTLAQKGGNLLIEYEWLEQPPQKTSHR